MGKDDPLTPATVLGRLLYRRRLGIVEPVFGDLHTHRLRRFTLQSICKVDVQWKLVALATTCKRCKERRRETTWKAHRPAVSSAQAWDCGKCPLTMNLCLYHEER